LKLPSFEDKTPFHEKLADLYIRTGQFADAIPHLEVVLSQRPRSDSLKIRLANCLVRSNRACDAMDLIDTMKHCSGDRRVITLRIEVIAALGSGQEAIDLCVRYLLDFPRDKRLRRLLDLLRKKGLVPTPGILEEKTDPAP